MRLMSLKKFINVFDNIHFVPISYLIEGSFSIVPQTEVYPKIDTGKRPNKKKGFIFS